MMVDLKEQANSPKMKTPNYSEKAKKKKKKILKYSLPKMKKNASLA